MPYPDDDMLLYYNPDGGKYYHSTPECSAVKSKYYPLTSFKYSELDTGMFKKLEPCPSCTPVKRKSVIDAENLARGVITQAEYDALQAQHEADASGATVTETPSASTSATPETTDTAAPDSEDENVVITIIPAGGSAQ